MRAVVHVKPGVRFDVIAPAGVRLLSAIETTARRLQVDLTITCACEAHPVDDPHTKGCAYDVRSHDLTTAQKRAVLREVLLETSDDAIRDAPMFVGIGLATQYFYGQIEHPDQPDEHFHFQLRRGVTYA